MNHYLSQIKLCVFKKNNNNNNAELPPLQSSPVCPTACLPVSPSDPQDYWQTVISETNENQKN